MQIKKSTLLACVAVGLLVGVLIGYVSIGHESVASFSPTGTTNSTAKLASTVMDLSSTSATTTSVFNNSGYDWGMIDSFAACNGLGTSKTVVAGAGLANLSITGATTSTAAPVSLSAVNTNYGTNVNVSTTTAVSYIATSTEGVLTGFSRIITNGTYYTFASNATNTASCTVGLHYLVL